TLNTYISDITNLPYISSDSRKGYIKDLVEESIKISAVNWNSSENSWDFKTHPLLDPNKQKDSLSTIARSYENWKEYANTNFEQLKENEEKLNEVFIDVYGLETEVTPGVSDKDITVAKIFDGKKD